ncbi:MULTISPECIES: MlaD family protein [unclassified Mycobacterium]|uniref:MlaD family protein n=1 Tax=unclassified Mycobacterium TaxID=2642494 RepID=UPI0004921E19|nr:MULTISPECIES: MlaD family protein [unclassified Mycobacterium]SEA31422.1 virulence factor Mce family protein [Mycobacterium sp. 283mftsu]
MIRNLLSVSALLTLTAASLVAIGAQGVPWFASADNRHHVTLIARDAGGLVARSPVLLRGVPIGEVSTIHPDAHNVSIDFWYPNTVHLPLDSAFRVENLSALGETYLSIKPNRDGGPTIEDNQRITADESTVPGTIGDMAVAVTRLLHDLDPQRFNRIIDELGIAYSDTASVPALTAASTRLNQAVTQNKDQLRGILTQLQFLLGKQAAVAPALTEMPRAFDNVEAGFQQLVEHAVALCYESGGTYPDDIRRGAVPVLQRLLAFEDQIGINLYNLTEPLLPPLQATAAAMTTIDTSRLLDATMSGLDTPGAFTVHVVGGQ